jgi:hypothetical protein
LARFAGAHPILATAAVAGTSAWIYDKWIKDKSADDVKLDAGSYQGILTPYAQANNTALPRAVSRKDQLTQFQERAKPTSIAGALKASPAMKDYVKALGYEYTNKDLANITSREQLMAAGAVLVASRRRV